MELWSRTAVVEVGAAGSQGLRIDSRGDGLRVAFEVTKTVQSESNKAKVQIYNLAERSRRQIAKGNVLRLHLGYGDALETYYEGEVHSAQSERSGPDGIMTIECGDGLESFKSQDVKRLFPSGTPVRDVIRAVAKRFTEAIPDPDKSPVKFGDVKLPPKKPSRLSLRNLDADLAELDRSLKAQGFSTVLTRRLAVAGSAKDVMDRLGRVYRFDWSVQDGVIQVVAYGSALVGTQAILLSPASGLLGRPTPTEYGAKFTSLILPGLRPGAAVEIGSSELVGQFRAEKVVSTGDTRGDSWTAETEARNL